MSEQTSPSDKVFEDPSVTRTRNIKKVLIIIGAIILVAALVYGGSIIYTQNKSTLEPFVQQTIKQSQNITLPTAPNNLTTVDSKAVFEKPLDTPILKVGSETLYQIDLTNYLSTYYPKESKEAKISPEILNKSLDDLATDSVILQEASKLKLITLSPNSFNNPTKNYAERGTLLQKSKEQISSSQVAKITGEAVQMWFNNATAYPPPSTGVEAAKQSVKSKMDIYREELSSKKKTFTQVATSIKSDSNQAIIDPSFRGNAYLYFRESNRNQTIYPDPQAMDAVWNLQTGEISPVILVRDMEQNGSLFEAYYAIVQVSSRSNAPFKTFDEFVTKMKGNYEITRI
jgi:hypothetical protein